MQAPSSTTWVTAATRRRAKRHPNPWRDQRRLVLAFYGDGAGPYWDNALLISSYPDGYSYFRPFRYRDRWIDEELRAELHRDQELFVGAEAVIALRFSDPSLGFIPIRDATITAVRRGASNSLYFRLGALHDYANRTFSEAREAFPETMSPEGALMFLSAQPRVSTLPPRTPEEHLARWADLIDALCAEPLVRTEPRTGVFFAVLPISDGRVVGAKVVENTYSSGPGFGLRVAQGAATELLVAHRVPSLIGSSQSVRPIPLAVSVSNPNFFLSTAMRRLTGNYDTFQLTVTAAHRYSVPTELLLDPPETLAATDGRALVSAPFVLKTRARLGVLYQLTTNVAPIIALWLAFAFLAFVTSPSLKHHPVRVVLTAAASGLAAVIIRLSRGS